MTRPDVIATMALVSTAGGLHHQGAALLTKDAFRAAGDPGQFPDQLRRRSPALAGAKALYGRGLRARRTAPGWREAVAIDASEFDPLLGSTYQELGSFARSMHKCQGMAQLLALPGTPSAIRYVLSDTTIAGQMDKEERSLFDGVDTSIEGLASYVDHTPPARLTEGLASIASHARRAQSLFEHDGMAAVSSPLVGGLEAVRALRSDLSGMPLDEIARYEIEARLATKQKQFEEAILAAANLRLEALADDGVIVGGQPIKVTRSWPTGERTASRSRAWISKASTLPVHHAPPRHWGTPPSSTARPTCGCHQTPVQRGLTGSGCLTRLDTSSRPTRHLACRFVRRRSRPASC